MCRDPMGLVAEARAAMLTRGYEPLALVCGPAFWRNLTRQDPALAGLANALGEDIAEVLDMLVSVRPDGEGFVVIPRDNPA